MTKFHDPKIPDQAEMLSRQEYTITLMVDSKFLEGKQVPGETIFSCPSCFTAQDEVDHGEHRECAVCGLHMKVWGNGLYIWR